MDIPVFQDPEIVKAQDAAILDKNFVPEEFEASGLIYVKFTPESKDMLQRVGYRRPRKDMRYSVRVVRDASGRLAVAPVQN